MEVLMRERDMRKVFLFHYIIFTLCKDYPDGACLYTQILTRFTRSYLPIDDGRIEEYDDDMNYYVTRDCW